MALRFTIVVPNLNGAATLERALRSIVDQEYPHKQIIVADGGSTDGSDEILQRYRPHLDLILSGPDGGQAQGLNAAFRHATGDVFGWLCSDDELCPGALAQADELFGEYPDAGVVAGSSERIYPDGSRQLWRVRKDAWDAVGMLNPFDQPSVFWRAEWHLKAGELDTAYSLAFDWEFWCRLKRSGAKLRITPDVLSRYHLRPTSKTSTGGRAHVEEGARIVRIYGPAFGLAAWGYRFLFEHFDMHGCMDSEPSAGRGRMAAYVAARIALRLLLGVRTLRSYNWHFAALQERGIDWWQPSHLLVSTIVSVPVTALARTNADASNVLADARDGQLPSDLERPNIVLNRKRLERFLDAFGADSDVRDLLLLDSLAQVAAFELAAADLPAVDATLAMRPFRLWEYVWAFKGLGLRSGGLKVLDAGGATSPLTVLAAMAGNAVVAVDDREPSVFAARRTAEFLRLSNFEVLQTALDDLRPLPDRSFDRVVVCSTLHRVDVNRQEALMRAIARVLKPDGLVALTFDSGSATKNATLTDPYRHHPPATAADIRARYLQSGLRIVGNEDFEDAQPGSLFRDPSRQHVIASLFLAHDPPEDFRAPTPVEGLPCLLASLAAPNLARYVYRTASLREKQRLQRP